MNLADAERKARILAGRDMGMPFVIVRYDIGGPCYDVVRGTDTDVSHARFMGAVELCGQWRYSFETHHVEHSVIVTPIEA